MFLITISSPLLLPPDAATDAAAAARLIRHAATTLPMPRCFRH